MSERQETYASNIHFPRSPTLCWVLSELKVSENCLLRENSVSLNSWHAMCIFQKTVSNVYSCFEIQEDYKNKLIQIIYLIGCNYILSKAQLFKPFIL